MSEMIKQIVIGCACALFGSAVVLFPRWIKRGASMPKLIAKLMRIS